MSAISKMTCETIGRPEVAFHPHSFADADGRLFRWRGQLYRGISLAPSPFFLRLLQDGTIQQLVDKGLLIDTQLTAHALEGFGLVVEHKTVSFVSYPQEWCAAMLRDGALCLLDLLIELAGKELTLKDAHPWNLLFEGCKPVFVDLTSIVPLNGDGQWQAYEEFCQYCYYPLILMSAGHERIARALLPEYGGVQRRELEALARNALLSRFILNRLLRRALTPVRRWFGKKAQGADGRINFLRQLREDVKQLCLPVSARAGETAKPEGSDQQRQVLAQLFATLRPASVIDVNTASAWGAKLAARSGSQVISLNRESEAATQLYVEAREQGLPILPLVMNFVKPTPSIGYSDHYLIAATERLRCEMVLALSVVRQAVFEYFLTFDLLAEGLASFAARWVVVEFEPRAERPSGTEPPADFPWYTLDHFTEALNKRFHKVEVISRSSQGSVLFLCEKQSLAEKSRKQLP